MPSEQPVLFDIPSLLGKDIDEIKEQLGTPFFDDEGPVKGQTNTVEWKTWLAPGTQKALHIDFDKITRQVLKIILQFDGMDINDMPTDPLEFLEAGNLNANATRYTIKLRESHHPLTNQPRGCFAGVDVVPAAELVTHEQAGIANMRYEACYEDVPLHQLPMPDTPEIGAIPHGTIIEVADRDGHWVKPKGMKGWAASANMQRIMDVPAPDLDFHSNGHKIIDGKFRNFFGIHNIGVAPYDGSVMLRLFNGQQKVVTEIYRFESEPILPSGGRSFYMDTSVEITRYEFEATTGKHAGETKGEAL